MESYSAAADRPRAFSSRRIISLSSALDQVTDEFPMQLLKRLIEFGQSLLPLLGQGNVNHPSILRTPFSNDEPRFLQPGVNQAGDARNDRDRAVGDRQNRRRQASP